MSKKVKKVDVKKVAKTEVNAHIENALLELGIKVSDGTEYGFTEGTLVVHMDKCDIQVKLIAPKAGVDRYEKLEEEEEEEDKTEEEDKEENKEEEKTE